MDCLLLKRGYAEGYEGSRIQGVECSVKELQSNDKVFRDKPLNP